MIIEINGRARTETASWNAYLTGYGAAAMSTDFTARTRPCSVKRALYAAAAARTARSLSPLGHTSCTPSNSGIARAPMPVRAFAVVFDIGPRLLSQSPRFWARRDRRTCFWATIGSMGPMIRAASLRGFTALVADLGGDPADLLSSFGIDPAVLNDDEGLIPITTHDLMLDAAARDLRCPDFGLRLATAQDLSILGPLAVAIEASSTVAEAVNCASRFLFVHSPALWVRIEEDPLGRRGVVALTYGKDLRESTYSPQGTELGLGVFHRMAASLIGGARFLWSVHLPHQPVSPVRRYLDYFGAEVRFGGAVAALCVQRQILDESFASRDDAIRAVAVEHLASQFPDPGLDLATQVRLSIAETLPASTPTISGIARLVSLHPRTLQRRLAAAGTSFTALLDEVRREAVHRYLTTTDLPVGQVAFVVGFGEQSTLTHAVHRWYGCSPRALRLRTAL
ncbi:AraC family transcriptional regulator [Actinophytocola sp. NPDC049390]|uniref:AraC family transcriptional regulator n=1 Tax=Actinophytocola sp. NPDC049390 TaxID=3363894 RepID=UPI003796C781